MKVAIYSRKSKFTGKGESIENQIQLCQEYAIKNLEASQNDIFIYEDEGFSGGNIDRPMFQNMIEDARNKKFDALICYRLDRISRNISDFSNIIELLQSYDIAFVSIKEQFDTSTPMGRAMMYIASVFAQLERETIAERIKDNMIQLAKTGRWLGGICPTGFESEPILYFDNNMKEKRMFKLSPIKEELNLVKNIFEKYIEFNSLSKLETYCLQNNITSKNDTIFSKQALRHILINPVYCIADELLYDYLSSERIEVCNDKSEFNGNNGILVYNKTLQQKGKTNKFKSCEEWIAAISRHKGIIESRNWIKVQQMLKQNKDKAPRQGTGELGLLSGLLKCSKCGSFMRPRQGRISKNSELIFYYKCSLKDLSKGHNCDMTNVKGNDLDNLVIDELKKISERESNLSKKINSNERLIANYNKYILEEKQKIESEIKKNDVAITNLVKQICENQDSIASKYFIQQIEELDKTNAELKNKLVEYNNTSNKNSVEQINYKLVKEAISNFAKLIDSNDNLSKKALLKTIVKDIVWNGEEININLFGFDNSKKKEE